MLLFFSSGTHDVNGDLILPHHLDSKTGAISFSRGGSSRLSLWRFRSYPIYNPFKVSRVLSRGFASIHNHFSDVSAQVLEEKVIKVAHFIRYGEAYSYGPHDKIKGHIGSIIEYDGRYFHVVFTHSPSILDPVTKKPITNMEIASKDFHGALKKNTNFYTSF